MSPRAVLIVSSLLIHGAAWAQEQPETANPPASVDLSSPATVPPPAQEGLPHGHLEYAFGFHVGQQDFGGSAWRPVETDQLGLVDPFALHPFELVTVSGMQLEQRLVWNQIRLGIGYRRSFPGYDFQEATHRLDGAQVAIPDFAVHELRLTIGAVTPTVPVAGYIDVAGDVSELRATLSVDGGVQRYRSSDFGLSLIAGVRGQTGEHTFLALQGEWGLTGSDAWGVVATVGFNLL
jgi:hypothetical protein